VGVDLKRRVTLLHCASSGPHAKRAIERLLDTVIVEKLTLPVADYLQIAKLRER
jgi:hypothetical protein